MQFFCNSLRVARRHWSKLLSRNESKIKTSEKIGRMVLDTAIFFVLCTVFSIFTDVVTKHVLGILSLPVTLTLAQFVVSAACGYVYLNILRLHPAGATHKHN